MIQKSLDNLSQKNSPLHFGFGQQDTTSSERYCTGGEFNSIVASALVFLPSLDHLVRSHQHVRRNRQADLLGGFQIDDELKLRRLLDRKVGGLGALEDLIHVSGGASVQVG